MYSRLCFLADGLLGLRENAIVHRDLKGSNVFIASRTAHVVRTYLVYSWDHRLCMAKNYRAEVPFTVKIGDFGLARFVGDSEELTVGVGTEAYMAREVRRGGKYGTESDLYSFGVMLKKDLEAAGLNTKVGFKGLPAGFIKLI